MMYPFLQIDGDTEIVHSEMLSNGEVKVYIEKPDARDGFHHAYCFLPPAQHTAGKTSSGFTAGGNCAIPGGDRVYGPSESWNLRCREALNMPQSL